ncbi:MAG: aldehyde dehydrogenase family protein [Planctomycetota bacterium]|jgi:succinate-semialdehyde dehydrogenase|nr:aldehyde dehydrogenase family protein [Planctomycetota bacterium]
MTTETISDAMRRARRALAAVETYSQKQVDDIARMFARIVYDRAEPLARLAVDETRMGVYEHKVKKNLGKARILWSEMKGQKSVGVLRELPEAGLIEIANPKGVIGAVTPCTNPIVTPMCNAMFAVKGRNVIIVAPHPRARKCAVRLVEMYREGLERMGVPPDIVQVLAEPSVELTGQLMKAVDVVIATGGMGMVKAAYSSGKPSFGVGAGNVQCLIDAGVDYERATAKMIEGRAFDNGIICSGEQTMIAPARDYDRVVAAAVKAGACHLDDPEAVGKLRNAIFPGGAMNKNLVGRPAAEVAAAAGVAIPAGTAVIIVKPERHGEGEAFSQEKMCPVMSAYSYSTWEEAVAIARENLLVEGAGHSVSIHSDDKEHLLYAGERLPVSRLLVNQICSTMNGGSFFNGLAATTTLGCGSWGNNSISENLSWRHLFNVSRIAMVKPGGRQPTDEEIWA